MNTRARGEKNVAVAKRSPTRGGRLRPFREPATAADAAREAGVGGLLNLGPKSSAWLAAAGIRTVAEVRALGPVGVCRRVIESGRPVSVLLAYAIEGGLAGCHWNAIPVETKQSLRVEFGAMKRAVRRAAR